MDIVIGTHALGLGGSETYAITLADHLQRLGHRVLICAKDVGSGEDLARAHGVEVVTLERYRASRCDRIVAQDGGMALELAERHPLAPLIFIAHSEEFDQQLPPQIDDLTSTVIVFNGRVERRVRALAADFSVVRLSQPIDVARFRPRTPPARVPRRLLMFGNNLRGDRLRLVGDAARRAGLELVRAGALTDATTAPELTIDDADIVMGYGRCALEGMACGRPTYVFDHLGGDGWVTPASYPQLEEDGFGGRALPDPVDPEWLAADLRSYRTEMGLSNRDLVVRHHRAEHHAQRFAEILKGLDRSAVTRPDALTELARLVRGQWAERARVDQLETHIAWLADRLAMDRAALEDLARLHTEVVGSKRHRIGSALARPLDAARARLSRGSAAPSAVAIGRRLLRRR